MPQPWSRWSTQNDAVGGASSGGALSVAVGGGSGAVLRACVVVRVLLLPQVVWLSLLMVMRLPGTGARADSALDAAGRGRAWVGAAGVVGLLWMWGCHPRVGPGGGCQDAPTLSYVSCVGHSQRRGRGAMNTSCSWCQLYPYCHFSPHKHSCFLEHTPPTAAATNLNLTCATQLPPELPATLHPLNHTSLQLLIHRVELALVRCREQQQ